jgi:regulator of replication initiation timing
MNRTNKRPTLTTRHRLVARMATADATVQELTDRTETLEEECARLRQENRRLRRELTHAQLIHDLPGADDETEAPSTESPPATARRLYRALPASVSFRAFFEAAEQEGMGADEARRCLRHFLARDLLVQDGARLAKRAAAIPEGEAATPNGTDGA